MNERYRTSVDAFVDGPRVQVAATGSGPLDGQSFAVKDLIDNAGVPTVAGNPDWARSHATPSAHALVVATLLAAGAHVVGKTRTDEISLGILGENVHDGMPENPRAPDRMPGGSSSGSASAVAAGHCDFALGTDTGGSVRVPAAFCGLYGIRPTHGRVDFAGVVAQAADYDTVGWFARDATLLANVGQVLFGQADAELPSELLIAEDALAFADAAVSNALAPALARLAAIAASRTVTAVPQGLGVWQGAQRILQSSQAARHLMPWLAEANPRLAFSVAGSMFRGLAYTDEERGRAGLIKHEANRRMDVLLGQGAILVIPTTPFVAPLRTATVSGFDRDRISCLTSIAGLNGLPQVSLPWHGPDALPVGLSIIGARGADMALLRLAQAFEEQQ